MSSILINYQDILVPDHLKESILISIQPQYLHLFRKIIDNSNNSFLDINKKNPTQYQKKWYQDDSIDLNSNRSLIDSLEFEYYDLFDQLFIDFLSDYENGNIPDDIYYELMIKIISTVAELGNLDYVEKIFSIVEDEDDDDDEENEKENEKENYYIQGLISAVKGSFLCLEDETCREDGEKDGEKEGEKELDLEIAERILELGVNYFGQDNISELRAATKEGPFEIARKLLYLEIYDEDTAKWILKIGQHNDIYYQLLESGDFTEEPSDDFFERSRFDLTERSDLYS